MCLAQGHNAVTPGRLEPAAPQSQVKHSTTEPLHSHLQKTVTMQIIIDWSIEVNEYLWTWFVE